MAFPKYDWPKLKHDFLTGDYKTVSEFLRKKGMPLARQSTTVAKHTRGWSGEKGQMREKALQESAKKMVETEFEDVAAVRIRQARAARFLQKKGLKRLEEMDITDIEDARKLVVSGLQEERSALGLNVKGQSLTQVNIALPKTRYDEVIEKSDYEGLLKFIAELKRLKRERTGRSLPEGSGASEGEVQTGKVK